MLRRFSLILNILLCVTLSGCLTMPEMSRQPQVHNPFPQLCKVAVAPFFNLTNEPTLDGRKVAIAYFNELQSVPGFEVVPVGVVETAMHEHKIDLRGASEARHLAQILKVDAVVIGAVTDYFPYYPPRMALQVEWYSANPGFHPIPPGYGLPWGTREEKDIPAPLIFEAELALAKAQLKTQTPPQPATSIPEPLKPEKSNNDLSPNDANGNSPGESLKGPSKSGSDNGGPEVQQLEYAVPNTAAKLDEAVTVDAAPKSATAHSGGTEVPRGWPDSRGFIPPPPRSEPPPSVPSHAPVLRHTRTYNGNDMEFTTALRSYYGFRDDARFGGWQNYLNRSDDFIQFCCHMHINEMLSARGGAGESRLVWRWPNIR
jgi:hypothetical protein